jgi:hypothetical protein
MPNVILCDYKNDEFNSIKKTFYNINRIIRKKLLSKYVDYKIINFNSDTELLNNIHSILALDKDTLLDVKTISYGLEHVDQMIYSDNIPTKFVMIRRKILGDLDSYTFSDFKQNSNIYTLLDLTENDLEIFFRSQFISKGILISNKNEIKEYESIAIENENNIGTLCLKTEDEELEYKYYNYSVHFSQDGEKTMRPNSLDDNQVNKLRETSNVTKLMSFREILINGDPFVNITYFSNLVNDNRTLNERMSQFFGIHIYGDVYLTINEHINTDCRSINFTKELYEKMEKVNILKDTTMFKIKNPYCCNPIRELMQN